MSNAELFGQKDLAVQNTSTEEERAEISFTTLASINWDEKILLLLKLPRRSENVDICVYQFVPPC